jgi:membrane-associated phospholipid phosphatase
MKNDTSLFSRWIRLKGVILIQLILGFGLERSYAWNGIEPVGDVLLCVLPAVAAGSTLHHNDTQGMEQLAKSLCSTVAVTLALKYAIHENRPDGGKHSFPSGHTSVTFSSAEFLRRRYGWKWGAPVYAAAAFVGYTRIAARQHFLHDVLIGAMIGFIGSSLFTEKRLDKGPFAAPAEEPYLVNVTLHW